MPDIIVPTIVKPLTFERYADISLAAGASYTPTVAGLYHLSGTYELGRGRLSPQYYSAVAGAWLTSYTIDSYSYAIFGDFISDGINFRLLNQTGATYNIPLMRMGYSKLNPSPKIGRQILYGKPCIVLESDEKGFIWIEEEKLTKLCEDIFLEVKEAKEKGEPHPLIGKTMITAIKEDVDDKMGYGKYKSLLRGLGFDV